MARAKNTNRAEARRKYREQVRAVDPGAEVDEVVEPIPQPSRPSMFRMPDIREDIRLLPQIFRTRRLLWLPFVLLFVTFVFALLWIQGVLPTDLGWLVSLAVELLLRPTGLFVFFIGGFLAPRASYLVGAILGLVDGILWALLGFLVPGSTVTPEGQLETTGSPLTVADAVVFILVAVVVGILAASFAAWYRNFLRSSQERARQNRVARDQERAAKAKAEAKAARTAGRTR